MVYTTSAYEILTSAWSQWTTDQYNSTATAIWENWNCTSTSTTDTYDSEYIWYQWIDEEKIKIPQSGGIVRNDRIYVLDSYSSKIWSNWTRDRIKERAQQNQADINRLTEKERKEQAEMTAQELLLELIGPKQMEIYKKTGRLFVKGKNFDYVLRKEGGVFRLSKDKVHDLCIHLAGQYQYPETDNIIGLKLLIEADEDKFNKTANNHGVRNQDIKKLRQLAA